MHDERPPITALAESIAAADARRQPPQAALPKGWRGLVERDRQSRASSHPNATGGFLNILYPWRLCIAVGGTVVVAVLLLVSAVT